MMTRYLTTIELHKESMKFAAGHTTIFSATKREPLHGHLYSVYLALSTWIEENGMTFDYRYYKEKIRALCKQLNQTFLMPTCSPFLTIENDADYYYFTFNHKKIPFLKEDVVILPLANITIEELSHWFLQKIVEDKQCLDDHSIIDITVKVYNGPGQSAGASWRCS